MEKRIINDLVDRVRNGRMFSNVIIGDYLFIHPTEKSGKVQVFNDDNIVAVLMKEKVIAVSKDKKHADLLSIIKKAYPAPRLPVKKPTPRKIKKNK